jgi:hypothetical protein
VPTLLGTMTRKNASCSDQRSSIRGFTLRVQRSKPSLPTTITSTGDGIANHAGVLALLELADRSGLTGALDRRPASRRERRSKHRPGEVLRDVAVTLADGGTCLSDLRALSGQPQLFGEIASVPTAWRVIEAVAADELAGVDALRAARVEAMAWTWRQAGVPLVDGMLIVDVDATHVIAHSDKHGAAGTYKGGFGFYPLLGYVDHGPDALGEPIAALLRAGNAGSGTVIDHHDIVDQLLDALPVSPEQIPMLVRCDSAGASHGFVDALHEADIAFSVGFPCDERVRDAVLALPARAWRHAATQHRERRDGAQVAELHHLDLTGWPPGSRAVARRERPHPGAQLTFTDADGWRVQAFITDQPDADIVELERRHRAHARVEDRIRDAKDTGLANLPFVDWQRNEVWLELVMLAQSLLVWLQRLCLAGELAKATPKTIRYRLLHVAARLVTRARRLHVRLQRTWPWTPALDIAFQRLRALPAA